MLHLKSKVQRTFSHIAKNIYNYHIGYISNLAGKLNLFETKVKDVIFIIHLNKT